MTWLRAALEVGIGVLACGCLRAPIELDTFGDTEGDASSSDAADDADGLGMTGPILPGGDDAPEGDAAGDGDTPACHPSYVPCLPVVDDLDCDEVRALDAAPVDVVGDDEYGLDADRDGVGCEG